VVARRLVFEPGGLGHGCPTTDPRVIGAGNRGDEKHGGCGFGRTHVSVLRALLSTERLTPRALVLFISFKDKNVVRLRGLNCVATITLDDKEPGNHTLATPRTMGPSWL
jgi:hypothetical protein